MSEATVKATRRQLRRVVGPDAAQVIANQGEAIASVQKHITERLDPHRDFLQTELVRQGTQFDAFVTAGWKARLKWVLGL